MYKNVTTTETVHAMILTNNTATDTTIEIANHNKNDLEIFSKPGILICSGIRKTVYFSGNIFRCSTFTKKKSYIDFTVIVLTLLNNIDNFV